MGKILALNLNENMQKGSTQLGFRWLLLRPVNFLRPYSLGMFYSWWFTLPINHNFVFPVCQFLCSLGKMFFVLNTLNPLCIDVNPFKALLPGSSNKVIDQVAKKSSISAVFSNKANWVRTTQFYDKNWEKRKLNPHQLNVLTLKS